MTIVVTVRATVEGGARCQRTCRLSVPGGAPGGVLPTPINPTTAAKYGRISAWKAYLRDGPSVRGTKLMLLNREDRVEILDVFQENTSDKGGVLSPEAGFQNEKGGGKQTVRGYVDESAVQFASRTWYKVRTANGQTGWVAGSYVSVE